jgi:hypothetical protein
MDEGEKSLRELILRRCNRCGRGPILRFQWTGGHLMGTIRCGTRGCENETRYTDWSMAKEEWNRRNARCMYLVK